MRWEDYKILYQKVQKQAYIFPNVKYHKEKIKINEMIYLFLNNIFLFEFF